MFIKDNEFNIAKLAYVLVTAIALVTILIYTEEYVIPFVVAMIIWFIIHELRENIQMIPFMKKHCPMWLQSMIGFFVICLVLVLVIKLLMLSMGELTQNVEDYQINLEIAVFQLSSLLEIDVMEQVMEYTSSMDFSGMLSTAADYATTLFGDSFLILIYVLFLLIEESIFPKKLAALYGDTKRYDKTQLLFQKMDKTISRYLLLKTFVSLVTGLLSYFVLLFFGLDAAIFWAMLIFVLNYIPTVGSLIATLFPAVFAILQFGEFETFAYVLVFVGLIQVIVGNVLEPKLMGNSLNISSLVVIISLTVWGAIWGVMGMILSVPITVMMIVLFEEIPSLKFIAVMLSESGQLTVDAVTEPEAIQAE
ncbi:MAG: AI-2E family transporter [Cyclobacteriaceae bacterium]